MPTSRTKPITWHLRQVVAVAAASPSDEYLLERFVTTRDEQAFATLVRRHGPMVLGVCRRILDDQHEADDAFQATFLVLATKAASVVPATMLPNWLYGVARQTAVRARSVVAKRRLRERLVPTMPEREAGRSGHSDDLRSLLDEVLARLPDRYRIAIVLCDLEGMTHQGAARHLGWPVGTLASRHSRGRKLLKERLVRRGLDVPDALSKATMSPAALSACLPPSLGSSTVQAGCQYGLGPTMTGSAISPTVVALTEGVLKAMSFEKLEKFALVLLTVGLVALGGGLVALCAAQQPAGRPEEQPGLAAAAKDGRKTVAADPPRARKDRLDVMADGKQVRVRAVYGDEELQATADRMSYDQGGLLVLSGNVTVQKRRGNQREDIQCRRMVVDRRAGTVQIEGSHGVRIAPPGPGSVPVADEFSFPASKGSKAPLETRQGPPKPLKVEPLDVPALEKELDALREKVKELKKRLSRAKAGTKDTGVAANLLLA